MPRSMQRRTSGSPSVAARLARAGVACALLAAVVAIPVMGRAGAADSTVRRGYSLEDSPGYYPKVDPESAAVRLGRRTNAPLVSRGFVGGARSLDDLGRAVCRALYRADADSLLALCIRDDEFRDILWREFPQSRPATGLTWEDAWRVLYARLYGGSNGAIRDHGGRHFRFLRFESDSVQKFRNFRLHHRLALVVQDDQGGIQRWHWVRSVAERRGVFKIYSTDD